MKARLLRGLTPGELSTRLGYTDSSVLVQIERGETDAEVTQLIQIASALDVPFPAIFRGCDSRTAKILGDVTYQVIECPDFNKLITEHKKQWNLSLVLLDEKPAFCALR